MTKFTVPFFYEVEYKPSLRYKHTFFKKVKAECSGEIDDVSKSDLKLALEVRREYALQSLCGNRNYYEYKGKLYTPLSTNVYSEKESYHDTDLWSEIISSEINLQKFFNHSSVDADLSTDYVAYGWSDGFNNDKSIIVNSNKDEIISAIKSFSKKVLICSIPQDVFIAAGATVKPSLVFFKRFTEEEELQYLGAKTRAEKEIRQKYIGQIKALQEKIVEEKSKKLKVKALIAAAEKELRDLEKAIIEEAKPLTKEYFDYEIPIAMVEDAGITSTVCFIILTI